MPWVDGEYVMPASSWPADNNNSAAAGFVCDDPLCDECCGNACDKRQRPQHSDAHAHDHYCPAEHDHAEEHNHHHHTDHGQDGCDCCHSHDHHHHATHDQEEQLLHEDKDTTAATPAPSDAAAGASSSAAGGAQADASTAADHPGAQAAAAAVHKQTSTARERWAAQVGLDQDSHDDGARESHGRTLSMLNLKVDLQQKSCAQAAQQTSFPTQKVRRLAS